jgi:meso-butanediol dehydrogenase/(S,S)-butanediol dehydrogenase/diacetyl reductase
MNKVSIVTGAVRGIGSAIALRLAKDGADIAVCDISLEGANRVVKEIEALGRKALAIKTDVSKAEKLTKWSRPP